ncbi:tetratricopeptide repeat protein [Neorhodopirellula lusitana]|uniref:tetratricopeptide repeat protein n=1 Tax=Neorhodopirellula lusitana TaxID=445327 RepID=UPI003850016F
MHRRQPGPRRFRTPRFASWGLVVGCLLAGASNRSFAEEYDFAPLGGLSQATDITSADFVRQPTESVVAKAATTQGTVGLPNQASVPNWARVASPLPSDLQSGLQSAVPGGVSRHLPSRLPSTHSSRGRPLASPIGLVDHAGVGMQGTGVYDAGALNAAVPGTFASDSGSTVLTATPLQHQSIVAAQKWSGYPQKVELLEFPGGEMASETGGVQGAETLPEPIVTQELRRGVMVRAARNAVGLSNLPLAIQRFEELLAEFPTYSEVKPEYVGLLIQANQLAKAEIVLKQLIAEFPDVVEYHSMYANFMLQQGKHDLAASSLQQIVNRSDASPQVQITYARILAWQGKQDSARQFYESRLRSLGPLPFKVDADLASLLLELDRPGEAIEVLTRLLQADPGSPSVTAALVLANARIGNDDIIHSYLESLRENPSFDQISRIGLADKLYREGHDQLALQLYQDATLIAPDDVAVRLRIARVFVRLYDMPAAKSTLDGLADHSDERDVRLETANYMTAVGEHARAYAIYQSLLSSDPADVDVLQGAGSLSLAIGDHRGAETTFRHALTLRPGDVALSQLLAESLLKQFRVEEAALVLEPAPQVTRSSGSNSQGAIPQSDIAAAASIADIMVRGKQFSSAEAFCDAAISSTDGHPAPLSLRIQLKTTLGFAQLYQGRNIEALDTFTLVKKMKGGNTAKLRYGLHQVLENLDRHGEAEQVLATELGAFAPVTRDRVTIAKLAMSDCRCDLAQRLLEQALAFDPSNELVMILLAESRSMCNRCSGACDDRGEYQSVLVKAPMNTRAQLGLARSYSRTNLFANGNKYYEQILTAFPQHDLARLEQARLTFAWKGADAANCKYIAAKTRNRPQDFLPRSTGLDVDLSHLEIEYQQAGFRLQSIEAERSAKFYKDWRPRYAMGKYRELNQIDPTNQESLFDLGQVYATLNLTQKAIDQYQYLLSKDPCHTEARIALRRMQLETHPQLSNSFEYEYRSGRQGLTDITTMRLETLGVRPMGDQDEFLIAGYAHRFLRPKQGTSADGNVGILGIQTKPLDFVNFFAIAEFEQYDAGFRTRVPFRTGLRWRTPRDVHLGITGFLENVAANGESIRQDVYRGGLELNAAANLSWRWDVDAMYRFAGYSDSNTTHEVVMQSNFLLAPGRNQWRLKSGLNFLSFDEQTVFNANPDDLFGILHPYFSPDAFSFGTSGLEYRRWVSPHNFRGADEHWYSIYGGARIDSDSVGYGLVELKAHRDYRGWLSTDVKTSGIFSKVYTSVGVGAFCTIRLP